MLVLPRPGLAAVCALPARGEEGGGAPGTLAQHKLNPLAYSLLYVDGPWVNGILVSHLWSVAGRSSRQDVSVTQIEMQVSYTFSNDWDIQMFTLLRGGTGAADRISPPRLDNATKLASTTRLPTRLSSSMA